MLISKINLFISVIDNSFIILIKSIFNMILNICLYYLKYIIYIFLIILFIIIFNLYFIYFF